MSNSNRRPYENATVLDQDFLDDCRDNLETKLELTVEIDKPDGTNVIKASDRPKYVGSTYYDNRLTFPVIRRTVGEWLSTELEHSVLKLELNNSDGEYDNLLPGGADYGGFIGHNVQVQIGLRDVQSTYRTIFNGQVSDVGGFSRTVKSIVVSTRDDYEKLDVQFPKTVLGSTSFPDIGESVAGTVLPVIYGDWTVSGNPITNQASVPVFIVNEQDPDVNGDPDDTTPRTVAVKCYISENVNRSFDTSEVYLKRGDSYYLMDSADITGVVDNRLFDVEQDTGNTTIDGDNYKYERGDEFFVKVEGKFVSSGNDNIVFQAQDILLSQTDSVLADFDSSWGVFGNKATSPDNISTIKSRVWIQDPQSAIQYALSMLEQVRLEAFIDRNLKIKINALHFDEFEAAPDFKVDNFDVVEGTLVPQLDVRNNFNRAQAVSSFLPDISENSQRSSFFRNQAAIDQVGKEITKEIVFPNLYDPTDVANQTKEIIKLASAGYEHIVAEFTWRAMLLDIGDFVLLNVQIGSTVYEDVPCMIRDIGYDPEGIKIPVKLWSMQLVPFPGFAGVTNSVGGDTATITEE
jgi:hypothetical protein